MAGRHGKTIDYHINNGNRRHLTKEEIETRQQYESSVKSGVKNFKASEYVLKNMVAIDMFKKLKKLYKNINCIEGMDENIINRYCLMISEADALEKLLITMNEDVEKCEEYTDRIKLYNAISGTLSGLNKTRDMLLKIEDRLLLNPIARIKNVPKTEVKKSDPLGDMGFGNV